MHTTARTNVPGSVGTSSRITRGDVVDLVGRDVAVELVGVDLAAVVVQPDLGAAVRAVEAREAVGVQARSLPR